MNNMEFEGKLEDVDMSKKEFAEASSLPYQTVMNWKRNDAVPVWVDSWLENYIKAKDMDRVVEAVKPHIK